jgi:predicted ferric reductase
MRQALRGLFWVTVYAFVVVAPLLVARVGPQRDGQGFVTDFSVALGFVALAVLVLQFGLVARLQRIAAPFGMDALVQYHRQIGFVALGFAILHPALVFASDPSKLALLDFPQAPNRARFAVGSLASLLLLVATSLWRKRLRLSYELWQLLHGLLALAVVGLGMAHMAGVAYYAASPWQRALWMGLAGFVVGDVLWVRLAKPLSLRRRPWRVREVKSERGKSWTLVLEPDGHDGMPFAPGQFAWLLLAQSPFSLSAHPFSLSSSAEHPERISFTIKERGDFSSKLGAIEPGTRAYVDGPYGLFTPDRNEGFGFVLVAGGVGITPIMSMLRTMADRGDRRPVLLLYATRDREALTFHEELDALAERIHLECVPVLEVPPEGWEGERGRIDAALLERRLPDRRKRYRYFVCGPTAMMDAIEKALVAVGVPDENVHTERFDMV